MRFGLERVKIVKAKLFCWFGGLDSLRLLKNCSKLGRAFICIGLPVFITGHAYAKDLRTHHYQVKIDKQLSQAEVKLCFDGKAPEYLAVDYRKATKSLLKFPEATKGHIEFQGRYWKTSLLKENSCIHYTSDISGHIVDPRKTNDKKLSFQVDNTWLWLPEKLSQTEQAVVSFDLPKGYQVSTPWRPLDKLYSKFLVGRSPHDWGMTLIIGEFDNRFYQSNNDSILNLVLLGELKQKEKLIAWIRQTERSLANFLGKEPLPMTQVVLIENRRFRRSPVPWGEVNRGGGIGIRFVVDSSQPIENFYQDWTATHEFGHLLGPKIDYRDSWLSEGLASYLQYILMAQSGNISEETAWQKLYEGLSRGIKGTNDVEPEVLRDVVENRRKKGSWRSGRTMRIYWSGAAYFLLADWQLREASKNKVGLAQILSKFNQCCVLSGKEWSGKEFSEKLDELSQTTVFSSLYHNTVNSESFPNIQPALAGLGIKIVENKVVLTELKGSQYRDSILTPLSNNDE